MFSLRGVVGDVMAELKKWLKKKEKWINENIVLFLPTTASYVDLEIWRSNKTFLRQEGMEGIYP